MNNEGDDDPSNKKTGTTIEGGAVFRVVSFDLGVAPRNHRANSIDYTAVMAGEIDMVLDIGTVRLKAGDVPASSLSRRCPPSGRLKAAKR